MKREKITGIAGTAILHMVLLVLLFWLTLSRPEPQEEGGVPVMFGNTEQSQGKADPYMMTEVDVMSRPESSSPQPEPENTVEEQPLLTQADEPSVQVKKEEKKKENKKKEKKPVPEKPKKESPIVKQEEKPKEKTEAEKRAEAERAAARAAAGKIAGAFGKGTKMGSKGEADTGTGIQGSPTGNSDAGKSSGVGGYGTFDLNGRSLGAGGLPKPVYNVQDEGRVVVTIVVNPAGQVISTSINKRTNTVNPSLRKAAEEAARRARFDSVSGVNNQTGTITYYFKLK